MNERIAAFLVWGLVGLSAGTYALKLWPRAPGVAAPLPVAERAGPVSLDRLLGAAAPEATAPSLPADARFQLLGLVAARDVARQAVEGLAVLSLDGQPPRAIRVGQRLDAEWQLMKVEPHGVQLGRGGVAQVQLRLEPPAAAVPGSLPPAPALSPVMPEAAPAVGIPPSPAAPEPVVSGQPGAQGGLVNGAPAAGPLPADAPPGRRHDAKARL
ncbi:hypothetical protein [Inhella gelatinilytica]|uniref:General secretion pathway protein C n=1 Tax=Inhella gelatinilytica TaxID=2795030 RepID=A0A931ITG3_9BURK|nr:hypothetical protein [Inhella gelatinilytica]MBH9552415.1 hypothetical protein [Inhella gelatinilytica]